MLLLDCFGCARNDVESPAETPKPSLRGALATKQPGRGIVHERGSTKRAGAPVALGCFASLAMTEAEATIGGSPEDANPAKADRDLGKVLAIGV